jgi:hypothetical protein
MFNKSAFMSDGKIKVNAIANEVGKNMSSSTEEMLFVKKALAHCVEEREI